jgi:ZIP family zinc transporter
MIDTDSIPLSFINKKLIVTLTLVFLFELLIVAIYGDWKVIGISLFAYISMVCAVFLAKSESKLKKSSKRLVWAYGLASGAMIGSACAFLLPTAILPSSNIGGFAVAFGVLTAFMFHTIGHQLTHTNELFDDVTITLTAHALFAGAVIGVIYSVMPSIGPLLGLAIVSHKSPAGYSVAKRRLQQNKSIHILTVPAMGVGLTALPVSLFEISISPILQSIIFGFATGLFIHIALDFLPRCEVGSDIYTFVNKLDADTHELLDTLRWHAVSSTSFGFLIVLLIWLGLQFF